MNKQITNIASHDLLTNQTPFYAKYKNRNPNPGICRILSIDWENKSLSMSNGICRYHPDFDEVEIVPANEAVPLSNVINEHLVQSGSQDEC